jgi:hypothetical protein
MPEELLERIEVPEVPIAPQENLVPPAPPEGLDTILYEHDEREARADLRRQIAVMELALARLFGSAFPRSGIDFSVPGMGGPRMLSVDELEKVRDGLAVRIQDVKADLHHYAVVEESNRELIEEMLADPASHKWERVYNEDIGEPGCKHWHVKPKWGVVGMLMSWWRVKISSGCPLAEGLRPPECPPNVRDANAADGIRQPDRPPSRLPLLPHRRVSAAPMTGPRPRGGRFHSPRSSSPSASFYLPSGSSSHRRRDS